MSDENTLGQEKDLSSSSGEKQNQDDNTSNASEGEKTQKGDSSSEGYKVPYERFQEVYRENKELKEQMDKIREDFATLKTEAKREQGKDFNPKAWDEVFVEAESRVLAKLQAKQESEQKSLTEGEKLLEREMAFLKESGEKFDTAREEEFYEFLVETKMTDVPKAYKFFKRIELAKDEGKQEGQKTANRKARSATGSSAKASEGTDEKGMSYKKLHNMSLDDIAEAAMRKVGLKS